MDKKRARPWLAVGALIYGVNLVNGLRFIGARPARVIALGLGVKGSTCEFLQSIFGSASVREQELLEIFILARNGLR